METQKPGELVPHSRRTESLILSALLLALLLLSEHVGLLQPANRFFHDTISALVTRDVQHSDVVIVAIDDKSVAALGRWPWPRATHATLINTVMKGNPRALGLDILMPEPDTVQPMNDTLLAAAMQRHGKRVVLPVMMQNQSGLAVVLKPIEPLASLAGALGHVHLAIDADGVARNIYLQEGTAPNALPHFSAAMMAVAGIDISLWQSPNGPDTTLVMHDPVSGQALNWQRHHKHTVPYAGPPGHFRRYAYIDLLDGRVPPDALKGKFVLVGATAAGLGDLYATPATGKSPLMPGVEIAANALDSLLNGYQLTQAPEWAQTLFNLAPVLVTAIGLSFLGPLAALAMTTGLLTLTLAGAVAARVLLDIQIGPASALAGLALAFGLWSWRRMDAATRYLAQEFDQFQRSGTLVPQHPEAEPRQGDFMDRRIHALTRVTQRLRDMHRFVSDSLNHLPDATLVCDLKERVLLVNAAALRHFDLPDEKAVVGKSLLFFVQDLVVRGNQDTALTSLAFLQPPAPQTVEVFDRSGRDLIIKSSPSFNADGLHTGWVVSLADVTRIKREQRQRDDALHFLSHDMRAPQSAILTLLDLVRQDPLAMPQEQFYDRVGRHARKALALSDDFIQLVKAQSRAYVLERHNLVDLLGECMDDAWEIARARQIGLLHNPSPVQADSLLDRELVTRAIGNLLGNAIKFSAAHTQVSCHVEAQNTHWAVVVKDQGPGIAKSAQQSMFRPFYRVQQTIRTEGTGLGLSFVKTVAERHGGRIDVHSELGKGSEFRFLLPQAPELMEEQAQSEATRR